MPKDRDGILQQIEDAHTKLLESIEESKRMSKRSEQLLNYHKKDGKKH